MKFQAFLASFSRSHFGVFGGFGLLLGYLASSGTKSDVIFLLGDPDFPKGYEISRLSCLVIEIPFWSIWGFTEFWGYLAASNTKSDVVLL